MVRPYPSSPIPDHPSLTVVVDRARLPSYLHSHCTIGHPRHPVRLLDNLVLGSTFLKTGLVHILHSCLVSVASLFAFHFISLISVGRHQLYLYSNIIYEERGFASKIEWVD